MSTARCASLFPLVVPPRYGAADVDVRERAARAHRRIEARAAGQLGMSLFHALDGAQDRVGVTQVDAAIVVEVVHAAIVVHVDDHVGGIAILVPARARGALADTVVVLWRAEPRQHAHAPRRNPLLR